MKTGMLIIGLILLLICALPVVLLYLNSIIKEKRFIKKLFNYAKQSNCIISEYDLWKNTVIGIDKVVNKLFFIRETIIDECEREINLSEIQNCRIANVNRTINNKNGNYKVTDKLELVFIYREKNKPETKLEFYNSDKDSLILNGEIQLAEKWSGLVETMIEQLAKV
jgi:hypothetical protein